VDVKWDHGRQNTYLWRATADNSLPPNIGFDYDRADCPLLNQGCGQHVDSVSRSFELIVNLGMLCIACVSTWHWKGAQVYCFYTIV
jgi:hypothetical protein